MSVSVQLLRRIDELTGLAPRWRELAGDVPFRAPEWLLPWWDTYGEPHPGERATRELFAVAVFAEEGTDAESEPGAATPPTAKKLVALAPWYVEPSPLWGRVVRQLGSGEVCSDYQTVLVEPDCAAEAIAAIADFLTREVRNDWDRLDLDGAVCDDEALGALTAELARRGSPVERRRGPSCWRVKLPTTFAEYLTNLSKSHRKQLRRLQRDVLATDRAVWHTARTMDEFEVGWEIFVDLHQRRRRSLGDGGRFESPCFMGFHREVARSLHSDRKLRLHWLELDGRPAAAEYHFSAGNTVFGYQSGLDPERLHEEPGRLAGICVVEALIEEGFEFYDLLRGDEPYKAHWRAEPTATEQVTVVNPRKRSRARHAVHTLLRRIKRCFAKGEPAGSRPVAAAEAAEDVEVAAAGN